jgi:hypothetical protein
MRRRELIALLGGRGRPDAAVAARRAATARKAAPLGHSVYSTPKGDPNLASFLRALARAHEAIE